MLVSRVRQPSSHWCWQRAQCRCGLFLKNFDVSESANHGGCSLVTAPGNPAQDIYLQRHKFFFTYIITGLRKVMLCLCMQAFLHTSF